jgi:hypothetical protein
VLVSLPITSPGLRNSVIGAGADVSPLSRVARHRKPVRKGRRRAGEKSLKGGLDSRPALRAPEWEGGEGVCRRTGPSVRSFLGRVDRSVLEGDDALGASGGVRGRGAPGDGLEGDSLGRQSGSVEGTGDWAECNKRRR